MEVGPVLAVTGVAAGGDGIARDESGRVVFVTGALPGERVAAEVTEQRSDFARARLVNVLEASPDRIAPPCPFVAAGCGGCGWQHVSLEAQRRLKERILADALTRLGRVVEPRLQPTVALPGTGYRTTVRLGVTPEGRAAYRRAASHDLVPVDSCMVTHPDLEAMITEGRWPGANEVVLRVGAGTGERLVWPRPGVPDRPHFHETLAGHRFRISAASFFQAQPAGAEALVEVVRAAMPADPERVLDLYAGVGVFAAALGRPAVVVESSAAAVADARFNLRRAEARVVKADVTKWRPGRAGFVVADPPRAGLGPAGVRTIIASRAPVVALVACDPASLARDARLLVAGGYRLTEVTPVDLFPHTPHVEAVAVFSREAGSRPTT